MSGINTGVLTDATPISAAEVKQLEKEVFENGKTFAYIDDNSELCFSTSGPVEGIKQLAWNNTYVLSNSGSELVKKHYRRTGLRTYSLKETFTKASIDAEWSGNGSDTPVYTNYYNAVYRFENHNGAPLRWGLVLHEDGYQTLVQYMDSDRFIAMPEQGREEYDREGVDAQVSEDFTTIRDVFQFDVRRTPHEITGVKYNEEYVNYIHFDEYLIGGAIGTVTNDVIVSTMSIRDDGTARIKQSLLNAGVTFTDQELPCETVNNGLLLSVMGQITAGASTDGDYVRCNPYSTVYPNEGNIFIRKGAMVDGQIPYGEHRIINNYMYTYKCKFYDGGTWEYDVDTGWGARAVSSDANPADILDSIDGIPVTDIYNNGQYT